MLQLHACLLLRCVCVVCIDSLRLICDFAIAAAHWGRPRKRHRITTQTKARLLGDALIAMIGTGDRQHMRDHFLMDVCMHASTHTLSRVRGRAGLQSCIRAYSRRACMSYARKHIWAYSRHARMSCAHKHSGMQCMRACMLAYEYVCPFNHARAHSICDPNMQHHVRAGLPSTACNGDCSILEGFRAAGRCCAGRVC